MRFLKKYWLELIALTDLELFLWSATRRYWERPSDRAAQLALDAAIAVSGVALIPLVWRLSKKWREQAAEKVRRLAHRLMRRISERVMQLLERWQRRLGRGASDLLGGRTRVEFDLFGDRVRRGKRRRAAWKQLGSERERLGWLYARMVEDRLRRGAHIRPSETPGQIAAHEDTTSEQCELIALYESSRYDTRREPPEGAAQRWRDEYT